MKQRTTSRSKVETDPKSLFLLPRHKDSIRNLTDHLVYAADIQQFVELCVLVSWWHFPFNYISNKPEVEKHLRHKNDNVLTLKFGSSNRKQSEPGISDILMVPKISKSPPGCKSGPGAGNCLCPD